MRRQRRHSQPDSQVSTGSTGSYGSRRHVAPFACTTRTLALKGFDARTVLCVRAYRKLEGLYDFTLRVTSLDGKAAGFVSQLDMFGHEFDAGLRFIERYLAAMETSS